MNSTYIRLFHILFVGGLFLYVGINREKIYNPLFKVLLFLGIGIILYHLYKIYGYLNSGKQIWVNLIHVFLVGPLLLYIGYNGAKTSRKFFEVLLMLGFAVIGYHAFNLIR